MNDRAGNTRQLRYMHTITLIGPTRHDLAQEDDFAFLFCDGYVHTLDARKHLGDFNQFMVVCSEEGKCTTAFVIVEVLDNGPRNGEAVIGAGTTANFIKDDEAAWCGM